ncbi:MAG: response regulator [Bdellovibrionota bacterium]|nr:MAG: response regulator [Bdellovibrionota bacterium]
MTALQDAASFHGPAYMMPEYQADLFHRRIIVPQIFLFVFLLFSGVVLSEAAPQTVQRLSAVAFLLAVSLLVRRYLPVCSIRILEVTIAALMLLLWMFALLFLPDSIEAFHLPLGLLVLTVFITAPPLPRVAAVRLVAFILLSVVCLPMVRLALERDATYGPAAYALVFLPCVALLLRSFLAIDELPAGRTRPQLRETASSERSMPLAELEIEVSAALHRVTAKRLALQALVILSGTYFFLLLVAALVVIAGHGNPLLLIVVPTAWCSSMLLIERGAPRFLRTMLVLSALMLLGVAGVMVHLSAYSPWMMVLGGSFVTLGIAALPFSIGVALVHATIALIAVCSMGLSSGVEATVLAMSLFACTGAALLGLLLGTFLRHELLARSLQTMLQRTAAVAEDEREVARMFAAIAGLLSHAGSAVMIDAQFHVQIITGAQERTADTDIVFGRALRSKLSTLTSRESVLTSVQVGEQFTTAFLSWFGYVPERMFCCRIEGPPGQRANDSWLVVPIKRYLPGRIGRRIERTLIDLSVTLHTALMASRSGQRSSETIQLLESLLRERDSELGRLVHTINNTVQEVLVWYEGLPVDAQPMFQETRRALSALAMSASDLRMEREALTMSLPTSSESVGVIALLEMLRDYADFVLKKNKGILRIDIVDQHAPDSSVRFAGETYLHLALRMVLRALTRSLKPGGTISLQVQSSGKQVAFIWNAELEPGTVELWPDRSQGDNSVTEWMQQLFVLTGGVCDVAIDQEQHLATVRMELERMSLASVPSQALGEQWALFVDDAAQVTNFYGKVAAALALRHQTAPSIAEAHRIMKQQGPPHLLVTDVQLTDGSGIELVRALRQSGNVATRIIVVSGESRDQIESAVRGLKVEMVLTKPVSRATLFDQIRRILTPQ